MIRKIALWIVWNVPVGFLAPYLFGIAVNSKPMKVNQLLFLLLFMLWAGTGSGLQSNVVLEGDVVVGNALPDWGTVCINADVRGGPHEMYAARYSVVVGQTVRIHDQSRPDGTWVSIGVAEWMPLKNLCR
ncbi:MAG TPA: hypothetical protein VI522_01005 [Gammaproteobacteria bacterium]|nr:hypothetical protein [Gammaproteobacteria bacterium]